MKKLTIETNVKINKELGLNYIESRVFDDKDDMVGANLNVTDFNGKDFYIDDVDTIEWEHVTFSTYEIYV